jgi:lysophospholipase L1-like esterase
MGSSTRKLKRALVRLQTGWCIVGITLLVLILMEAGFRAVFAIRDKLTAAPVPDRRLLAEGYAGATWPVTHYRELELLSERWQPYVYFRQKPFQGETIRIRPDGLRDIWHPLPGPNQSKPRSIKLLMLGGSSLWGYGARDENTIPSLVAKAFHDRGARLEPRNLAEMGYVSTQEFVALFRELQAGYRPDVVVFYDGVNDTTSALLGGAAGLTTNEVNREREFNLSQSPVRLVTTLATKLVRDSGSYRFAQSIRRRFGRGDAAPQPSVGDESVQTLADAVVRTFEANVTLVESLAKSYGFRPLFFWQPTVFTKPKLVAFEEAEATKYAWTRKLFDEVYARIGQSATLKANRSFHNLSGIFDGTENLVFIDYCHTTETANALIAAEIARQVEGAVGPAPTDSPAEAIRGGAGTAGVK